MLNFFNPFFLVFPTLHYPSKSHHFRNHNLGTTKHNIFTQTEIFAGAHNALILLQKCNPTYSSLNPNLYAIINPHQTTSFP